MLQVKFSFGLNWDALDAATKRKVSLPLKSRERGWFRQKWKIILLTGQVVFVWESHNYIRVDLNPNRFSSLITVRRFLELIANVPSAAKIMRVHFNVDVMGVSPIWAAHTMTVPKLRSFRKVGSSFTPLKREEFTLYFGSAKTEQIVVYNVNRKLGRDGFRLRFEARLNSPKTTTKILIPDTNLLTGPDTWPTMTPFHGIEVRTMRCRRKLSPHDQRLLDHFFWVQHATSYAEALKHLSSMDPAFYRFKALLDSQTMVSHLNFDPCFQRRVHHFLSAPMSKAEQHMIERMKTSRLTKGLSS